VKDKNSLVLDNEALVRFLLKSYAWRDDYEDLLQEGRLALYQAAEKYDPAKGKFSSFAARYIRNSIQRILRSENRGKRRCPGATISLNEAVGSQDGQTELLNLIPDERGDLEADAMGRLMLDEIIPSLESRELKILMMRAQGYDYRDIALAIGVSRQRVQQLLRNIGVKYDARGADKSKSKETPTDSSSRAISR